MSEFDKIIAAILAAFGKGKPAELVKRYNLIIEEMEKRPAY